MAIGDDFTIDYTNKRVYHSSGSTVYTTNALYSWLMDEFDELTALDDTVPMSAQTPNAYTLINGWFVDDGSFEYLSTGSIETSGWDASSNADGVRVLSFSVYSASLSATDIGKPVVGGTTGDSGTLLAYDNTLQKWWVRTDALGDEFDQAENCTITGGTSGTFTTSGASTTGECFWANIYTLGTLESGTNIYVVQDGEKLTSWWSTGHIDVLVKVRESGTAIDGGILTVFARQYMKLYDHYEIDLIDAADANVVGQNAVPLATFNDLNNQTASATVISTYGDIDIYQVCGELDYDNQNTNFTLYETITGASSGHTAVVLADTDGGSSGTLIVGNATGTFTNNEQLNGSVGGSNMALANGTLDVSVTTIDKDLNNGNGAVPYDTVINCEAFTLANCYEYFKARTQRTSTFTFYQNDGSSLSTIEGEQYQSAQPDSYALVKASPLGTYQGGTFFGARGVWIYNYDSNDAKNFQLIDSENATQTPPNVVSVQVTSLVSGDRVAIFELTGAGGSIDKTKYTAAAGNNSGNGTLVVKEAIESDTPSSGVVRIDDTRYEYTSWATSTFTLSGTLSANYAEDTGVYVPIIDEETSATTASNTLTYGPADIPVLVRVRRIGIIPFEVEGSITSTGLTVAAIRTTDNIVTT